MTTHIYAYTKEEIQHCRESSLSRAEYAGTHGYSENQVKYMRSLAPEDVIEEARGPLEEATVIAILKQCDTPDMTKSQIARDFGLARDTVVKISYGHIYNRFYLKYQQSLTPPRYTARDILTSSWLTPRATSHNDTQSLELTQ